MKEIEKNLTQESSSFRQKNDISAISVDDIRSKLKEKEIAIEITHYKASGNDVYAAFIIRPGDEPIEFIRLFNTDQIAPSELFSRIENIANAYNATENIKIRNKEYWGFYKSIVKPLEPYLGGTEKVYYSGSGILNRINLSAIKLPNGKTFGATYNIKHLSSMRKLGIALNEINRKKSALLIGGINYDDSDEQQNQLLAEKLKAQQSALAAIVNLSRTFKLDRSYIGSKWQYLPYTKIECDNIKNILDQNNYQVNYLSKESALENRMKELGFDEGSPQIIHMATHGFFFADPKKNEATDSLQLFVVAEDPMLRSGLILAGANSAWTGEVKPSEDDGILTAYEISILNLNETDLVVLSACDTGLGEIDGTEGVYGLQRAFLKAGVNHLIMSLWKVPDQETSEFMIQFYDYYLNKGFSIDEAFRLTQIDMQNKYDNPYLWAGFVLIE